MSIPPWERPAENAVGKEIAGAVAAFFHGGAGPTHSEVSTALALAGVADNGEGTKQSKVLNAIRTATDDAARTVVDEVVGALRTRGDLEADPTRTSRLREALARRGAALTADGFVDWPGSNSAAVPPEAPTSAPQAPPTPVTAPIAHTVEVQEPSLDMLLSILRRLPSAIRPLMIRRLQRPGLQMVDEYDVQDAAEAALRLVYADVRHEEFTPSSAGSSSRMDLLVKAEQCAVETKVTRPGRAEKDIKKELLVDINDFKHHPTVKTLVIVVYDLAGTFANAAGFEDDLSGDHNGLDVRVLVVGWPVVAVGP